MTSRMYFTVSYQRGYADALRGNGNRDDDGSREYGRGWRAGRASLRELIDVAPPRAGGQ